MTPTELREVPGFPRYMAGTDGTVWSRRGDGWRPLKPVKSGKYLNVSLSAPGKPQRPYAIHAIVLMTFRGPCPDGHEAAHGNRDPHDNRLDNLRWATPGENAADRARHGTVPRGTACKQARLTPELVAVAKAAHKRGLTFKQIASVLGGVSWSTIQAAVSGRNWKGEGGDPSCRAVASG